ncbi:MAG: chromate transporter [Rhodoferax sp.]|nr:chromate transporter [Rhodoferax sp.]NCP55234.1 chromate transporter [Rhodoferax sp.]OIP25134.1 MAG: chromate transporter [Comamonadaceae bacterium CG2_30_60_41]PIW06407.1 MAG: chromate transporter [Comamonadaceae bacterium CG17_big_fil_post_rev_8_21_14_2_50_60_13]PJC18453.1 MAG: chromate transporter [Comamonadaceae bacterium CG_4_9_14_0_8_um_filter_60_18]
MSITLTTADWLTLLTHFLTLSLLAIGGAITTVPDMHRVLVDDHHWLLDNQFNASIALAQAAPGPNVLFVALLGWNVGLNAAGGAEAGVMAWASATFGMLLTMVGILLPSTTLTFVASRWGHQNRELRAVRAFKQGMAPIVVGLLLATGWVLTTNLGTSLQHWPLWLIAAFSALVVWRTRLHLLWLLGAGGLLGWFGVV